MKMKFPVLYIATLVLVVIEFSEARETFLTKMCYRTKGICQRNCEGVCKRRTYRTGDCWGFSGQQCVNRLGFVCRCTDFADVSWPKNFQVNQEAYKEQQGYEQKQEEERLAAQQRAEAAEQASSYGGPMDYGGPAQFPDYSSFTNDFNWPNYDPQQMQQLQQMYQMPADWPPQEMPNKNERKF